MDRSFQVDNIEFIQTSQLLDKNQMLDKISKFIASKTDISQTEILSGLHKREIESNTAIGSGIAIPHAVLKHAKAAQVYLFLVKNKVNWQAYDGRNVDIIFTLIIPKEEYNESHLRQISVLVRHLMDENLQIFLRTETNQEKIYQKIKLIQEQL